MTRLARLARTVRPAGRVPGVRTGQKALPQVRAAAASAELLNSVAVFSALGDGTRLALLAVLCAGGAMSIMQLTAGVDISRQAVTKHLQVLAQAGLVRDVKVGRERLWAFEPGQIEQARRSLELIARQWYDALEKLKLTVED